MPRVIHLWASAWLNWSSRNTNVATDYLRQKAKNLRFASARTAPTGRALPANPSVRALSFEQRDPLAAWPPGLRPFGLETVHWTLSETVLTPSLRALSSDRRDPPFSPHPGVPPVRALKRPLDVSSPLANRREPYKRIPPPKNHPPLPLIPPDSSPYPPKPPSHPQKTRYSRQKPIYPQGTH